MILTAKLSNRKQSAQKGKNVPSISFIYFWRYIMAFFTSAVGTLQTLVVALGVWGVINLLEGYGNDNPGAKSQGIKHLIPKLM